MVKHAIALMAGVTVLAPVLFFVGGELCIFISHGYPVADMDWNNDGSTSLAELTDSIDVGARAVVVDRNTCREYFAFKDGRSLATRCP